MPSKTKEMNEEKSKRTTAKKATVTNKKTNTKKATKTVAKKSSSKSAKKVATKKSSVKKATAKKSSVAKKSSTTNKKTTTSKKVISKKASTKAQPLANVIEYYDLPYRYNETIVKILYQTPDTLFVNWDISDSDRENYIKQYGENFFNITRPVLIVHNDTMNYSFEISINDFANSL